LRVPGWPRCEHALVMDGSKVFVMARYHWVRNLIDSFSTDPPSLSPVVQ
jgi:hypothetical protein